MVGFVSIADALPTPFPHTKDHTRRCSYRKFQSQTRFLHLFHHGFNLVSIDFVLCFNRRRASYTFSTTLATAISYSPSSVSIADALPTPFPRIGMSPPHQLFDGFQSQTRFLHLFHCQPLTCNASLLCSFNRRRASYTFSTVVIKKGTL